MASQVEHLAFAPCSVVVVLDEEWFVTSVTDTVDGALLNVYGLPTCQGELRPVAQSKSAV